MELGKAVLTNAADNEKKYCYKFMLHRTGKEIQMDFERYSLSGKPRMEWQPKTGFILNRSFHQEL